MPHSTLTLKQKRCSPSVFWHYQSSFVGGSFCVDFIIPGATEVPGELPHLIRIVPRQSPP